MNPTFNQFVNTRFADIFDGLITGGTKEMKSRFHQAIMAATNIMNNGGFAGEEK